MRNARTVYTIGYSCHTLISFAQILAKNGITAVVDVRSQPYSRFKPEFSKDSLSKFLRENEVTYVFLGDLCGARIDAPECYTDGKVNYKLIAKHSKFLKGLARIQNGMQKYTIALMCAEKDPITCHRTILICRYLRNSNVHIRHLLCDGTIEEHHDAELRLMKLFNLDQPHMFANENARLDQAYDLQAGKIAYQQRIGRSSLDSVVGE